MPNTIYGYRYDPNTDSIETQPKAFDADRMRGNLEALRNMRSIGYTIPSPEHLAATALLEGQSNFGYDRYDTKDKKAVALYKQLQGEPFYHSPEQAGFAAAIYHNQKVAERKNDPLAKVWNGYGVSKATGLSGDDYAESHQDTLDTAVPHPKNAQFVKFIDDTINPIKVHAPDPNTTFTPLPSDPQEQLVPTADPNKPLGQLSLGAQYLGNKMNDLSNYLQKTIPLPTGYRKGGRVRMI